MLADFKGGYVSTPNGREEASLYKISLIDKNTVRCFHLLGGDGVSVGLRA